MSRLLILFFIIFYAVSCSTFQKFLKKDAETDNLPLIVSTEHTYVDDSFQQATEEGKIKEGMTTDIVLKSWGEPITKVLKANGFLIWEYEQSKLYFLEDVLISWDEND